MRVIRGTLFAIIAVAFVISSAARAEDRVITLGENNVITLEKAIEMAYLYNLNIKQAQDDKKISVSKLKEAKAQNGFSLGLSGSYAKTIGGEAVSFSLPVYSPMAISVLDATGTAQTLTSTNLSTMNTTVGTSTIVTYGVPTVMSTSMMDTEQKGSSFTVKKPIYTFGLIENNIKLNRLGVTTSDLSLSKTRLDTVLKVRQAYYQYALAVDFLEVAKENLNQFQAHYNAAKARFEAGASPKFDVIRSEVDVASSKENLLKAEKAVALARMALCNVIGIDVSTPILIEKPKASSELNIALDKAAEVALKERIELKQLALGQEQAKLGAKLSRLTPTVGFQGTYSLLNEGSSFGQQDTWQLAVGVEVPMTDGGISRSKIKQAKQTGEKLKHTEEQAKQGIILQVNEAFLSLNESKARIETSQRTLETAMEAVRMAEAGYKEGVTPSLDVIDAQNGANGARLNAAQAKFDYEIAKAKLLDAMGVENLDQVK